MDKYTVTRDRPVKVTREMVEAGADRLLEAGNFSNYEWVAQEVYAAMVRLAPLSREEDVY
jgi:hypothetical protein